ncbi:MAG: phosphotransferase [Planctomycetales bacterium]|nr:phosphotransferase [Planctomycetales bacterium]
MTEAPFVKRIDVSEGALRFRIEVAKALCMERALEACPTMSTPRLLEADEVKGELVFERIKDPQPLRPDMPCRRFEDVGSLLSFIHQELRLPSELTIVRKVDEGCDSLVYIHGDFQPGNLAISGDQLVVFDWGVRPWGDEMFTCSSPVVDLASFLAPWFLPRWWDLRFPVASLRAFVASYLASSSAQIRASVTNSSLQSAMQEHYLYHKCVLASSRQPARSLHFLKTLINTWRFNRELLAGIDNG